MKNKNAIYAGIVVGLVIIAFGIAMFSFELKDHTGTYSASYSYGGDAYTGIQNAAADTANNVRDLGRGIDQLLKLVKQAAGFILLAFGMFDVCYFWEKLNAFSAAPETAPETMKETALESTVSNAENAAQTAE